MTWNCALSTLQPSCLKPGLIDKPGFRPGRLRPNRHCGLGWCPPRCLQRLAFHLEYKFLQSLRFCGALSGRDKDQARHDPPKIAPSASTGCSQDIEPLCMRTATGANFLWGASTSKKPWMSPRMTWQFSSLFL